MDGRGTELTKPAGDGRFEMTTVLDYTAYDKGRHQLTLGIRAIRPDEWTEPDDRADAQIREKYRLLNERHGDVFAALPGSETAQAECLSEIIAHLKRDHLNRPAVPDPQAAPLDAAARLVQDDLLLMERQEEGWL